MANVSVEKNVEKKVAEPTYTVDEFKNAPHSLGEKVTTDLVIAAFSVAKKREATVEEAKKILQDFMKKEVK